MFTQICNFLRIREVGFQRWEQEANVGLLKLTSLINSRIIARHKGPFIQTKFSRRLTKPRSKPSSV